ncbi:right-handed parallel beta-helix repeat-containing protein [Chitinophaga qingshengii]|uniref:Right-handed parallel beta-helix repeat-containing protein n=1 Tax=Chitinophaga qingshengii TaxID=1569794 RepID=A0ABR7TV92_9BACT|nr:right-handed parallel beta-helix repeat-containing protein [Chitinophaga qingshengii]MBC9934352.1 right-handed parallel beta-helix repeat-containing protein [Chitinophaga qingshengii]
MGLKINTALHFAKGKKMALAALLLLSGVGYLSSNAQFPPFKYNDGIAGRYVNKQDAATFRSKAATLSAGAFDLTGVLPAGYVKDGTVDYTSYLQKGMDEHKTVIFPDFPVLISDKGLTVGNGANIIFKPGSKVLLQPTAKDTYEMLRVHNVQNVNIYCPVLEGDRKGHMGNTGQWGMGIAIRASKNVNVYAPQVSNCWGDGIYVGGLKDVTSSNINIYNAWLNFNRRNGMSISSVDGLKLIRPVISNTYGQAPMCGIDIEPNNNNDVVNNVTMDNPVTLNNAKHGINISLFRLIGPSPKDVNVTIRNHQDDGSAVAFAMGGLKPHYDVPPMKGTIEIIDPVWKNNVERAFRSYKPNGYAPSVKFTKVSVLKTDRDGRDKPDPQSFMLMKKTISSESKMSIQD